MKALQYDPSKRELNLVDVPRPVIADKDDVLVEVAYSGICGTDVHIIQGEFPCSETPIILGHEFSGIVRGIGTEVNHVKVGDHVAIDPQSWCSTCAYCTTGRTHCCDVGGLNSATGIYRDGGWAEYCKVASKQAFKLSPELSLKQGALCEPMSCVLRGWERLAPLEVGSSVLVTGTGIIGNLWAALLHHSGHRQVTLAEVSETRRRLTSAMDTGYECVHPSQIERCLKEQESSGFDIAIDCSGSTAAIEQCFRLLKTSGKMCIFGVAKPHDEISISPYQIFRKELTIVGAMLNPFTFKKATRAMEAMGSRYLDYEKLGIQEFEMSSYTAALNSLQTGSASKAVFKINANV